MAEKTYTFIQISEEELQKHQKKVNRKCCIPTCEVTNLTMPVRNFFAFPSQEKYLDKYYGWINAINKVMPKALEFTPTNHSRICSDHFITGTHNYSNCVVDYVPTIFQDVEGNVVQIRPDLPEGVTLREPSNYKVRSPLLVKPKESTLINLETMPSTSVDSLLMSLTPSVSNDVPKAKKNDVPKGNIEIQKTSETAENRGKDLNVTRRPSRKCAAPNCKINDTSLPKRVLFRFPSKENDKEKYDAWIKAINKVNPKEKVTLIKFPTLCSDHFVTGRHTFSKNFVDYAPTIFSNELGETIIIEQDLPEGVLKLCHPPPEPISKDANSSSSQCWAPVVNKTLKYHDFNNKVVLDHGYAVGERDQEVQTEPYWESVSFEYSYWRHEKSDGKVDASTLIKAPALVDRPVQTKKVSRNLQLKRDFVPEPRPSIEHYPEPAVAIVISNCDDCDCSRFELPKKKRDVDANLAIVNCADCKC